MLIGLFSFSWVSILRCKDDGECHDNRKAAFHFHRSKKSQTRKLQQDFCKNDIFFRKCKPSFKMHLCRTRYCVCVCPQVEHVVSITSACPMSTVAPRFEHTLILMLDHGYAAHFELFSVLMKGKWTLDSYTMCSGQLYSFQSDYLHNGKKAGDK